MAHHDLSGETPVLQGTKSQVLGSQGLKVLYFPPIMVPFLSGKNNGLPIGYELHCGNYEHSLCSRAAHYGASRYVEKNCDFARNREEREHKSRNDSPADAKTRACEIGEGD